MSLWNMYIRTCNSRMCWNYSNISHQTRDNSWNFKLLLFANCDNWALLLGVKLENLWNSRNRCKLEITFNDGTCPSQRLVLRRLQQTNWTISTISVNVTSCIALESWFYGLKKRLLSGKSIVRLHMAGFSIVHSRVISVLLQVNHIGSALCSSKFTLTQSSQT